MDHGHCAAHPTVVVADVLVCPRSAEGVAVCGARPHVPGIEAVVACRDRVVGRIVVGKSHSVVDADDHGEVGRSVTGRAVGASCTVRYRDLS